MKGDCADGAGEMANSELELNLIKIVACVLVIGDN